MVMWLPIFSASSRSWLTKMMVFFSSRLQLQQFVLQLGADQRVERRERLVHQQDRRFGGKGAGKADALLHAAGELVGVFLRPLVEIDQLELPLHARLALGFRHAGKFEAEADILLHRAPRQQAELLEHHRHLLLPQPPQASPRRR